MLIFSDFRYVVLAHPFGSDIAMQASSSTKMRSPPIERQSPPIKRQVGEKQISDVLQQIGPLPNFGPVQV